MLSNSTFKLVCISRGISLLLVNLISVFIHVQDRGSLLLVDKLFNTAKKQQNRVILFSSKHEYNSYLGFYEMWFRMKCNM